MHNKYDDGKFSAEKIKQRMAKAILSGVEEWFKSASKSGLYWATWRLGTMQGVGSKTGLAQQVQGQQEGQYVWIGVREWRAGIRIAHIQYHLVDKSFEEDMEPLEGFWA